MIRAVLRSPEYIDDVNGKRHFGKRRIGLQAPHVFTYGVDRDHLVACLDEILPNAVNRLTFFIFCTNDGDCAGLGQKFAHPAVGEKCL